MPNNELTYLDFEKEINSGNISPVYFVSANDNYFLKKAGELLREKIYGSKDSKENFFLKYGDETGFEEIMDLCNNFSSLFSEKKIVFVKRCEKYGRNLNGIIEYSKHLDENTVLLLVFDNEFMSAKKFDKSFKFYDFSRLPGDDYLKWIKSEFNSKGCKIGEEELTLFASSVPSIFDLVDSEIQKISNYFDDNYRDKEKIVTKDIILKLIGYDADYTPDELMSSILKKNTHKALEILENLLNKESINPIYLLSIISNYYTDLMVSKSKGFDINNTNELYVKYKLWGDRIRFIRTYGAYIDEKEFEHIFDKIIRIDQKLKTTSLNPGVLFTSLIQELSNFH